MAKETPQSSSKAKRTSTESRVTKTTTTTNSTVFSQAGKKTSSNPVPGVQYTNGWEEKRESMQELPHQKQHLTNFPARFETHETHSQKSPDKTTLKTPTTCVGGHICASDSGDTSELHSITESDSIALGISMICEPSTANIRASIRCEKSLPASKYLSVHLGGWADTKEYKLGGELLQCPADSGVQTGEFKTRTYPTWLPEVTTSRIRFAESIEQPKIVLWLKKLEMSCKHNWCINITASGISSRGFQLNIHTWGGSRVFGIDVTWIAYSGKEKGMEILSGVVGGGMPGSVRQERSLGGVVSFPEGSSKGRERKRDVLLALSGFDVKSDGDKALNIQARGSNSGGTEME
ncbi:hypothetical protein N431DRAFT_450320 [Stipitochalara longipes BDJ]|nr:hypothetical protein N431DRAFT_450320 [Stipitochalara longipes BDJ]